MQPDAEASVNKLGYKIRYDPKAPNAPFWKNYFAKYEPQTYNIFSRFINNGTTVLDVGAWVGLTALWSGHVAKKVFALEPSGRAFDELKMNLHANPDIASRVELIHKALGAVDDVLEMTNEDHATDHFVAAKGTASEGHWDGSTLPVKVTSIDSLREDYPELENTGFVKIDTEGYERVIVPALEKFFKEKKPVAYISLHQFFIGHAAVQSVVDKLAEIFPYLYEADMVTPFNAARESYSGGLPGPKESISGGDYLGVDILCTWEKL